MLHYDVTKVTKSEYFCRLAPYCPTLENGYKNTRMLLNKFIDKKVEEIYKFQSL